MAASVSVCRLHAAKHRGFYQKAGLDVSFREAGSSSEPVESVLNRAAQFWRIGGRLDLIVDRNDGKPVVALFALCQHSPLVLLTKATSHIDNVHGLAGQKIMIEPHAAELRAYLKDEHVAEKSLIITPHSFDLGPLIKDEVSAMSAYLTDEPFTLGQLDIDYRYFTPTSSGIDFYNDVLFTTERQINNHPDRVRRFVAASKEGWDYAFAHPDEIIDLILTDYSKRHSREHLKYEASTTKEISPARSGRNRLYDPSRWQQIANTYADLKLISKDFSVDDLLYDDAPRPHVFWPYLLLGGCMGVLGVVAIMGLSHLSKDAYSWGVRCVKPIFKKAPRLALSRERHFSSGKAKSRFLLLYYSAY